MSITCGIIKIDFRKKKKMDEKDAIIDFLLNQKVQTEIDNTTFISKVSNSYTQHGKKPI